VAFKKERDGIEVGSDALPRGSAQITVRRSRGPLGPHAGNRSHVATLPEVDAEASLALSGFHARGVASTGLMPTIRRLLMQHRSPGCLRNTKKSD
jgi:hypothetical protein